MELINVLTDKFMYLFEEIGYFAVALITAMEYACLPFMPSEIIFPFVGIIVSQGMVTFFGALIASIIGGLIGSLICYYIGYYGGTALLEKIKIKFPKTKGSLETIDKWFGKYDKLAVLFTRLVPLTRTYISFMAGSMRMRLSIFMVYSVVGITIWNSILIPLGYFVGNNWAYINIIMKNYSIFVLAVIAILSMMIFLKVKKSRKISL